MKALAIIPAYNEEKNLNALVDNILTQCDFCDILIINDCSTDSTSLMTFHPKVKKIDLPCNLGIGGAVQTGYKYSYLNNYDIAIQVDGDGQHNPKYLKGLIEEVIKGSNMALGSRFIEKSGFQSTFTRRIGIRYFTNLIYLVTGKKVTDPTSGFRACDRKVIELFAKRYPVDYPEPETIVRLFKSNLTVKEIPVEMNERANGVSSISSLKSIYYMIKVTMAILIASISK